MTGSVLPFRAESPDELLVPYVNGSLGAAEREAVERWLAENPAWQARLASYRAISAGVRAGPSAPAAAALTGLWRALDAAAPSPRSPAAAAPAGPEPPPAAGADPRAAPTPLSSTARPSWARGVSSSWMLAAAAVLIVVAAGAFIALRDEGGSDRLSTAAPESPAGAAGSHDEMMDALVAGARATSEMDTADVVLRAEAVLDLSGTPLADEYDAESLTYQFGGVGQLDLPGRAILETQMVTMAGDEQMAGSLDATVVQEDGRTWVRCDGRSDFAETSDDDMPCLALPVGSGAVSPAAAIALLLGDGPVSSLTDLGTDSVNGVEATGYELTSIATVRGEPRPIVLQIWVDVDSMIRRIVGLVEYGTSLGGAPSDDEVPTRMVASYDLPELGVPVAIPDMD